MKTDLPSQSAETQAQPTDRPVNTEWKPRKVRIAGEQKTVYFRETKPGNYAIQVRLGREAVTIYRRPTPTGGRAFMVANYAEGKRRFDCYADKDFALEAANNLVGRLSKRQVVAAAMTNAQAADYAAIVETLAPFHVNLPAVASTVADCLTLVGDLATMREAAKFFAARHRRTERKTVAAVVAELLSVKQGNGASKRYLEDLRSRLGQFAEASGTRITSNVTTADLQSWLDGLKLKPQSHTNFRRVLHAFFAFAMARGYAVDNPAGAVERVKVRGGDVEIFTPSEIARLLTAASPDFQPCLAIGSFAGLRSAEIERLEWSDIDLAGRHITVGASKAKTATRRVVPISDNLAAWLAPYANQTGLLWKGTHEDFYQAEQETAAATAVEADPKKDIKAMKPVKWKANGLRHSYASYRFAQTGDAGRVAGELGNSAAVVHKHYRELVKPAEAVKWFAIRPEQPANVAALPAVAAA